MEAITELAQLVFRLIPVAERSALLEVPGRALRLPKGPRDADRHAVNNTVG